VRLAREVDRTLPRRQRKPEYVGIEKSAFTPMGIGTATSRECIYVTFYWSPPEDERKKYVKARVALDFKTAKDLIDTLSKLVKRPPSKKTR